MRFMYSHDSSIHMTWNLALGLRVPGAWFQVSISYSRIVRAFKYDIYYVILSVISAFVVEVSGEESLVNGRRQPAHSTRMVDEIL
jgi:hypothetical protein